MDYELINKIERTIPIAEELYGHQKAINANNGKIRGCNMEKDLSKKPNTMRIVIVLVITEIVTSPLLFVASKITNGDTLMMLPMCLVISAVVIFAVWKLLNKFLWANATDKECAEYDQCITRCEAENETHQNEIIRIYNENKALLDSMPPDYLYPEALESIYGFLRNQRADTLKEAINLYEDQLHKMAVLENQKRIEQRAANAEAIAYAAQQTAEYAYYRD